MVFTEKKIRNNNEYYYRIFSFRNKNKISKKRVYLGKNLSENELKNKEVEADKRLYNFKRDRREEFEIIKKKILKILKEKGIKKAGIFGSYARGEQKKNSDIDLLIQRNKNVSGLNFVAFQRELSEKMDKKIDIITYNGINHLLKKEILEQEVRII